jgi:hypothetical protein
MKEIIENSLQKAMNYHEYRSHLEKLVSEFNAKESADDLDTSSSSTNKTSI